MRFCADIKYLSGLPSGQAATRKWFPQFWASSTCAPKTMNADLRRPYVGIYKIKLIEICYSGAGPQRFCSQRL